MWLFFAILSPICWAFCNPLDSGLRRYFIKNDLVLTCLSALARLPVVVVLLFLFREDLVLGWPFFGMLLSGVLWTLPFIFYYKSLECEETSRVVLILQFMPVFVLSLAAILIKETLNLSQFIAFVLILSGSILAAFKKIETKWHFSKVFFFMVLAALMWALADVLFKKFAVYFPNFWSAFAVDIFGSSLPAFFLFLIPRYRKFIVEMKNMPMRGWKFFIVSVTFGTFGSLTFAYALTIGKAALTSVISGIQPLFALFFGCFLARFFREIPGESLLKVDLITKALSFVLMFSGLVYLYL